MALLSLAAIRGWLDIELRDRFAGITRPMAGRKSGTGAMVAALVPIYGITLIDVFGYMIMIPLLPYLAQKYGASGIEVGALLATMAVASTVAAPVWGALSDRIGRKPIVLVSQVVSLAGYVALAFAPSLGMLFIARGVAGIGGGNLGVTQSYIADVTSEEYRDRAYAAFGVVFGLGIVLGPVSCGFLVHFGYGAPFLAAAGIEIVNILLALRFLPQVRRKPGQRFELVLSNVALMAAPAVGGFMVDRVVALIGAIPGAALLAAFALGIRAERNSAQRG